MITKYIVTPEGQEAKKTILAEKPLDSIGTMLAYILEGENEPVTIYEILEDALAGIRNLGGKPHSADVVQTWDYTVRNIQTMLDVCLGNKWLEAHEEPVGRPTVPGDELARHLTGFVYGLDADKQTFIVVRSYTGCPLHHKHRIKAAIFDACVRASAIDMRIAVHDLKFAGASKPALSGSGILYLSDHKMAIPDEFISVYGQPLEDFVVV